MKHTVIALTVLTMTLFAAACTGRGASSSSPVASTKSDENVEQVVSGLEQSWAKAIIVKDAATIDRLLDDQFMGTTDEIRYTKAEAMDDVKKANEHYEQLQLDDINVRVFGDVAIATMDQAEKGFRGGEVFSGQYLFTNVWVKRSGQWRCVSSHGSTVK